MDITVKINGICASGNHVYLTATVNGTRTFDLTLTKSELNLKDKEPEEVLYVMLRNFIKESGLTNWSKIKTAVEGHTFKI